jgi:hypothetical protein
MRIAGQWLARRLKRRLLDAVDRCDLLAIENRYGLEQHPCLVGLFTGLRVALADRHRRRDPDRFGPFTGQYPSFSHALNPATNVASGHASATSNWLLGTAARALRAHGADANPLPPPVAGQQLLSRLLQAGAVGDVAALWPCHNEPEALIARLDAPSNAHAGWEQAGVCCRRSNGKRSHWFEKVLDRLLLHLASLGHASEAGRVVASLGTT